MEQMREILKRINEHGEMNFKPKDDSQEAIKEFQAVAKRIAAAHERGYLVNADFIHSRMEGTYGYIMSIIINGGLTFEGEQFLSSQQKNDEAPTLSGANTKGDIFEIKPEFFGISLNLNEVYKRLKSWWQHGN